MENKIGIIVGSLRKESFSKKIANAVADIQLGGFEFEIVSIDNLPVYNQDFDDFNNVPEEYTVFRNKIKGLNAFIFITPEYNRSIPGCLKNAVDIGSRPSDQNVWDNKPAAVFSSSPGNIAAFGANHHLRQCFVFLNLLVMQQPEVYIANISEWFDDEGKIKKEENRKFIRSAVEAFTQWIARINKD